MSALALPSNDALPVASPDAERVLAVARAVAVAALPEVSWLPVAFTPGRLMSAEPSKETPPIVLAFCRTVAEAALPVVSWLPVWSTPGRLMFAEPSNDTPPIVLAVASWVAVAALPEVSWLPAAFTPGRLISEVPSKDTPPMLLAVARAVAVAALPVVSWLPVWFTPGRLMFAEPSKDTPPIVRAVSRVVAVSALPVTSPVRSAVTLVRVMFESSASETPFDAAVDVMFVPPVIASDSVSRSMSSEPESPVTVRAVPTEAVLTLDRRPFASTVMTGIAVVEPYEPAETPVFARSRVTAAVSDPEPETVMLELPASATVAT